MELKNIRQDKTIATNLVSGMEHGNDDGDGGYDEDCRERKRRKERGIFIPVGVKKLSLATSDPSYRNASVNNNNTASSVGVGSLIQRMCENALDPLLLMSCVIDQQALRTQTLFGQKMLGIVDEMEIFDSVEDIPLAVCNSFHGTSKMGIRGIRKMQGKSTVGKAICNVICADGRKMSVMAYVADRCDKEKTVGMGACVSLVQIVYSDGRRKHEAFQHAQEFIIACKNHVFEAGISEEVPVSSLSKKEASLLLGDDNKNSKATTVTKYKEIISMVEVPNVMQLVQKFYIDWDMMLSSFEELFPNYFVDAFMDNDDISDRTEEEIAADVKTLASDLGIPFVETAVTGSGLAAAKKLATGEGYVNDTFKEWILPSSTMGKEEENKRRLHTRARLATLKRVQILREMAMRCPAIVCEILIEMGYIDAEDDVQVVVVEATRLKKKERLPVKGDEAWRERGDWKISIHFIFQVLLTRDQFRRVWEALLHHLEEECPWYAKCAELMATEKGNMGSPDVKLPANDSMGKYMPLVGMDVHPYHNAEQGLALPFSRKTVNDPESRLMQIMHIVGGKEYMTEIPSRDTYFARARPWNYAPRGKDLDPFHVLWGLMDASICVPGPRCIGIMVTATKPPDSSSSSLTCDVSSSCKYVEDNSSCCDSTDGAFFQQQFGYSRLSLSLLPPSQTQVAIAKSSKLMDYLRNLFSGDSSIIQCDGSSSSSGNDDGKIKKDTTGEKKRTFAGMNNRLQAAKPILLSKRRRLMNGGGSSSSSWRRSTGNGRGDGSSSFLPPLPSLSSSSSNPPSSCSTPITSLAGGGGGAPGSALDCGSSNAGSAVSSLCNFHESDAAVAVRRRGNGKNGVVYLQEEMDTMEIFHSNWFVREMKKNFGPVFQESIYWNPAYGSSPDGIPSGCSIIIQITAKHSHGSFFRAAKKDGEMLGMPTDKNMEHDDQAWIPSPSLMCMCMASMMKIPFTGYHSHDSNGILVALDAKNDDAYISCLHERCNNVLQKNREAYVTMSVCLKRIERGDWLDVQEEQRCMNSTYKASVLNEESRAFLAECSEFERNRFLKKRENAAAGGSAAVQTHVKKAVSTATWGNERPSFLTSWACKDDRHNDYHWQHAKCTCGNMCNSANDKRTWMRMTRPLFEDYLQSKRP